MNLSIAFFAFCSALHSVHGQEATSLRGNVDKETLAPGHGSSSFRLFSALKQADTRIIGGEEAIEDRFPYAVYLTGGCTGSLIARDVVLSAAHCLGVSSAVLGRHNVVGDDDGEVIAIREQVPHPEYDDASSDNDFMLVFLEGASSANNAITVKLNSDPSVPSVGQDVTVMGWGDTNIDENIFEASDVLMNVDVNIISNDECGVRMDSK
ncbi:hypothetical protein ACHAW5_005059 [Stephanodiscus triporus]|uniref:Peptidase S1 domain-containing protein n=1 Tax=Stephanodiscus triporus TaxID=2934178 RepID=A0ABD3NE13_9STRA